MKPLTTFQKRVLFLFDYYHSSLGGPYSDPDAEKKEAILDHVVDGWSSTNDMASWSNIIYCFLDSIQGIDKDPRSRNYL